MLAHRHLGGFVRFMFANLNSQSVLLCAQWGIWSLPRREKVARRFLFFFVGGGQVSSMHFGRVDDKRDLWLPCGSHGSAPVAVSSATDPPVYIVTQVFVSRIGCKLIFAVMPCWGLGLPDVSPNVP